MSPFRRLIEWLSRRGLAAFRSGIEAAVVDGCGGTVMLGDKAVGTVRRVAVSPKYGIVALALLRNAAEPGTTVECGGRTAEVVALPFARDERASAGCS